MIFKIIIFNLFGLSNDFSGEELLSTLSKVGEFLQNKIKIHKTFASQLSSNKHRQTDQIILFDSFKSVVIFGQEEAGSGVVVVTLGFEFAVRNMSLHSKNEATLLIERNLKT